MTFRYLLLTGLMTVLGASAAFAGEALGIHGPDRIGAEPNRPFLYLIPATGEAPLHYAAKGLPPGVTLNSATGVMSGTPTQDGTYKIIFGVKNAQAHAFKSIEIVVAPKALALTPIMGWNPWYTWGCNIDDKKIRAAADTLVRSRLAGHGYNYINIDDCWAGQRNAQGEMVPNSRFPDMKALSDYVHAKGLHLGIYTSPGEVTCGKYPASIGHVPQDVNTYARWGMDLIKYDWCHWHGNMPTYYKEMSDAIHQAPRSMVHMICQYGIGDVWKWGALVGGNMWRTNDDLYDDWASIVRNGFNNSAASAYAGPGHWNDLDMLMVGKANWPLRLGDFDIANKPARSTRLSPDEQLTHLSIWTMMASPLIISSDLNLLDAKTMTLLTNDEVLAIDQDRLGKAATRVASGKNAQVWARPLADGSIAMALFNLGTSPTIIHADLKALGYRDLRNTNVIRDVWAHTQIETSDQDVHARVPAHGVALFKIRPQN